MTTDPPRAAGQREHVLRSLVDAVHSGRVGFEVLGQAGPPLLGLTGAGLSVMTEAGNSETVFTSDGVAARIEELQFTLGEGPCMDAYGGGPVLVADIEDPAEEATLRWPAFRSAAAAAGVRAVFAFPLRVGSVRLGVMDMYRDRPGGLDPGQLIGALITAEAAATSLLTTRQMSAYEGSRNGSADRSADRIEVHQATGMLMVQLGVSAAEALVRLRASAFAHDRTIAEVAADVVARRLVFPRDREGDEDR